MTIGERISFRDSGFTLVELLVGLVVGALVILAVLVAWGISVGTTAYTFDAARLNHDLRSTMQIMVNDLRRADAGSVQFSVDASCVSFTVAPRPWKIATGVCGDPDANDPECWVVRGFRLVGNDFQMYYSEETAAPVQPICSDGAPDDNWHSIYGDLAVGGFEVDDFRAECQFLCMDLDDPPGADVSGSGDAACSPTPFGRARCTEATPFDSWVERLSVTLMLGGAVQTRGQPKRLELENTVAIRNNHVVLD
ncbi:hypothetical protein TVNIR_0534 [Thioalkalivibrio nitratireducens DSM 14787]|uniref:Prepilin-type N-terminal cleavage/methylation domain-containing protein n=1 Tax=Thioalkalivibrio nitratireducens (strain DSM 14787 / UNIQEM 213 / ALEN2) TaxID=1255043 RepID=L0DV41_THIND|nr:prepilin-type N-terminal cleavage/methylation domain-containing protein [Thioalkalivibrio nitratireducens]AGA32236.1 hypothetical protein TVNIR_0534 [Thioalkalivibrio nitratireducens DSM 14787]